MPLILPNSFENLTPADAVELDQNMVAIQTYINTDVIQRDGTVGMASPLLLPGNPTQTNHASNKGYVDTRDNTLGATYLKNNVAGQQTMDGSLKAPQVYVQDPPNGVDALCNKGYVDTHLTTAEGDARYLSQSEGDSRYVNVGGDSMSGDLNIGNPPNDSTGVSLYEQGQAWFSSAIAGDTILRLKFRGTAGSTNNQFYVRFINTDSNASIGSITKEGGNVAFNTSSDPRLKENLGPITDAADRVQQLGMKAFRGRWLVDEGQGREWDMLSSHDIEDVAAYAVTGERDAEDPQQVSYMALVPLLVTALAEALDRIDALEAAQ